MKVPVSAMLCTLMMASLNAQSPTPAPGPTPQPLPCSAAEHRQFDFWIGEWSVTTPDGQPAGTNVITSIYGGCAIREVWTGASGFKGESFNLYDRSRKKWHQSWIDSTGSLLLIDGAYEDGKMRMTGTSPTSQGDSLQRITWTPLGEGRIRQVWEQSMDDGKTWTVAFDGLYTRKN